MLPEYNVVLQHSFWICRLKAIQKVIF